MNETQELERIFSRTEIFGELQSRFSFRRQELIGTWVDCMLDLYAEFGGHGEPVFAITDWEGSGVREEFSAVQEEIRRRGLTCAIADPRSFRYRGRRLIADGLPVDILYRRAVNFECAQRAEEIGPLIRAYKDEAVCMIGPFTSQILHNKTVFWILRRPEVLALFTEEERRFVEDHVPLTMKLSDDRRVIDFARCSRESLVLKPADRYAARDVFAGRDLTDGEWKSLLEEKSGEGGFLLQEFCDSGLMPLLGGDERGFSELNCRNVLGLYMYDGVFRGVYTRVGISSIIASVWKCKILPGLFIQKAYEK